MYVRAFLFNKTLKQFVLRFYNFIRLLKKEKFNYEEVFIYFNHNIIIQL